MEAEGIKDTGVLTAVSLGVYNELQKESQERDGGDWMNVLIVVDMQVDFVDGALGTKEAVEIVPNVVEKIKGYEGEVIYTMDTHGTDYLTTQEGKNLPVEHCIRSTKGWELVPEIKKLQEEAESKIFEKDTFGSIDLVEYMKELNGGVGIERVDMVGLCTDICVISNALLVKAAVPQVPIYVWEACTAGVTPESKANALSALGVCQVGVL